ncbi:MAG: polyhydroxyalkanoic acid system family protein [Patescibacteria group bacterium]
MPTVVESHRLTQDEALGRIKGLLNQVKTEYVGQISNLQEEWNGNSGTFSFSAMSFSVLGPMTFNVSGILIVTDRDVTVKGDFPSIVGMFKGKIEDTIRERVKELLA